MGTQIANEHFLPFFSSSFSYLNNMAADSQAFRRMMDPRVVHSQSWVLVCSYLTKRSVGFLFLPISSNEPETDCMCQVLAFLGRPRPSQMQRFIFLKIKSLARTAPSSSLYVGHPYPLGYFCILLYVWLSATRWVTAAWSMNVCLFGTRFYFILFFKNKKNWLYIIFFGSAISKMLWRRYELAADNYRSYCQTRYTISGKFE
jgi:hypothetical protein